MKKKPLSFYTEGFYFVILLRVILWRNSQMNQNKIHRISIKNSKHDDVPNIMWTCICQLCIREDQNANKKTKTLYFGSMFILISWKILNHIVNSILSIFHIIITVHLLLLLLIIITTNIVIRLLKQKLVVSYYLDN